MLGPLRKRPAHPVKVLEVGPGTGAITFSILRHLRPGDVLDIYELNQRFFKHLHQRLPSHCAKRPGVEVGLYHRDIRHLQGRIKYDYIISGLPFANFDAECVREIIDLYLDHLAPKGVISYFEYLLPHRLRMMLLKPHRREQMRRLLHQLETYTRRHQTHCDYAWINLPPARTRHLQHQK